MFLFSLMFPHKYVWGLRQEKRAKKKFFVRSLYSFSVARNWRSKRARGKSFRLHLCSVAYTGESKVLSPLENVEKARKMFDLPFQLGWSTFGILGQLGPIFSILHCLQFIPCTVFWWQENGGARGLQVQFFGYTFSPSPTLERIRYHHRWKSLKGAFENKNILIFSETVAELLDFVTLVFRWQENGGAEMIDKELRRLDFYVLSLPETEF